MTRPIRRLGKNARCPSRFESATGEIRQCGLKAGHAMSHFEHATDGSDWLWSLPAACTLDEVYHPTDWARGHRVAAPK